MLVDGKRFDGSSSFVDGYRSLPSFADDTVWLPTYTPRPFPQRASIHRLLSVFYHHHMCCFLAGSFALFTAGIVNSFDSVTIFVALTEDPLIDILFRRGDDILDNFTLDSFDFIFIAEDDGLDIYHYTVSHENFATLFTFFGISTSNYCDSLSNLNFVNFIWDNSDRLSFAKHAILLFSPQQSQPPILLFLRYHRAKSDGWTDIDRCLACVQDYQLRLRPHNNCNRPDNCYCDICKRQPPSLHDSASHILFRCVLDIERFELTSYITYGQYTYAVQSGRVDNFRLLPPEFPFIRILYKFHGDMLDDRYHDHCANNTEFDATIRTSFVDIETAVQSLVRYKRHYRCKHCERGLFFFPPTCPHHH
jgi:hypothetical protein